MNTEEAVELVLSGRYKDLSPEDLMLIKDALAASSDPRAVQALVTLQSSPIGQNMTQAALNMYNVIENNAAIVSNLENNFNLFELNEKGQPVHAEILPIFNFFSRVQVENKPSSEYVKAEDLFAHAVEIAKNTAYKELFVDANFGKHKPEEQKKNYINAVLMAMEENAFVLVSNQIVENVTSQKQGSLTKNEKDKIANVAEKRFSAIINPESKIRFKLTNTNIIGTSIAEINRNNNFAEVIQKNTGSKQLIRRLEKLDEKLVVAYPKSYEFLRPLAKAPNLGFLVGHVGKTSFTANTIAEAVHSNNPAKKQNEISLFTFFKQQPSKIKKFSRSIISSMKRICNILSEITHISELVSEKINIGFRKMFSQLAISSNGKYKGVGLKTIEGNMKIMSANVSQILNQPSTDKRIIAWKDFGNTLRNSQLGRAISLNPELNSRINPERTTLVPDNQADYTKVTPIVLPSKTVKPVTRTSNSR